MLPVFIVCFETGSIRQRAWPAIRKACNPVQTNHKKGAASFGQSPPLFISLPSPSHAPLHDVLPRSDKSLSHSGSFLLSNESYLWGADPISNSHMAAANRGSTTSKAIVSLQGKRETKATDEVPGCVIQNCMEAKRFPTYNPRNAAFVGYVDFLKSKNSVMSGIWRVSRNFFGGGECYFVTTDSTNPAFSLLPQPQPLLRREHAQLALLLWPPAAVRGALLALALLLSPVALPGAFFQPRCAPCGPWQPLRDIWDATQAYTYDVTIHQQWPNMLNTLSI